MAMLLFFANTESLKTTQRKGWVIRGIENGESVADHMHKMGLICLAYPWVSTIACDLGGKANILKLYRNPIKTGPKLSRWLSSTMCPRLLPVILHLPMELVEVYLY